MVALNMLIESRAKDVTLFLPEDIRDMDRFRDSISWVFLVCESARRGIIGASSEDEVLCLPEPEPTK
jgi:hypothetical protein